VIRDGVRELELGEGARRLLQAVGLRAELIGGDPGVGALAEVGDRRSDVGGDLRRRATLDLSDDNVPSRLTFQAEIASRCSACAEAASEALRCLSIPS